MQNPLKVIKQKVYRGYNLIKQKDWKAIFQCKNKVGFTRTCINSLAFLKYDSHLEDKIDAAPKSKVEFSSWVERARTIYASHLSVSPSTCLGKLLEEALAASGGVVSNEFFVRIVQRDLGLLAAMCIQDSRSINSIMASDSRLIFIKDVINRVGMYVAGMRDEAVLEDCLELVVGTKKLDKVLGMLPDRIKAPRDLVELLFSYISHANESSVVEYIVNNFRITIYKAKKESSVKEKLLAKFFHIVASGKNEEKEAQSALKHALLEARAKAEKLEEENKLLKGKISESMSDACSDSLDFCPSVPDASDPSVSQNTLGSITPPQLYMIPLQYQPLSNENPHQQQISPHVFYHRACPPPCPPHFEASYVPEYHNNANHYFPHRFRPY